MERKLEITIEIGGHRKDREEEIMKACMVEWNFREDDFTHVPTEDGKKRLLQASALGTIYGGEEISELFARIERAVWRANDGVLCHVRCQASRIEEENGIQTLEPFEESEPERLAG